MLNSKKTSIIRQRVLEVIHQKIDAAQKEYDEAVVQLETKCTADHEEAETRFTMGKNNVADKLVAGILGKIV